MFAGIHNRCFKLRTRECTGNREGIDNQEIKRTELPHAQTQAPTHEDMVVTTTTAEEAFKKSNELLDKNDFENALKFYERGLELAPQNATLHGKKGITLRELGLYDKAIETLDKGFAIAPTNGGFLLERAMCNSMSLPSRN